MTWTWHAEGAQGEQPEQDLPAHPNQSDAESWLGEHWRELAADGVARVTLFEAERAVYGPMPLSED